MINKTVSITRKLTGFFIDITLAIVLYFVISLVASAPIYDITDLQAKVDQYQQLQIDYKLLEYDEFGKLKETSAGKDINSKESKAFHADSKVNQLASQLSLIEMLEFSVSFIITASILFLMVPLMTKSRSSIGKIVTKQRSGHIDDLYIKRIQIFVSFLVIFLIDGLLSYFIALVYFGEPLFMVCLVVIVNIFCILISKNRATLNELFSYSKSLVQSEATLFKSYADKEKWLEKIYND